jgi:hypothetical protein
METHVQGIDDELVASPHVVGFELSRGIHQ